ncbi:MAG: hypothetical protein ACREGF_07030, partial [Candidatus Saccharimonadales bacterium]
MKKTVNLILAAVCVFSLVSVQTASVKADSVTPPPPAAPALTASPIIITALKSINGAPVFVQLYNNSDSIVDMHGWKLELDANNSTNELNLTVATFSSWLTPRG